MSTALDTVRSSLKRKKIDALLVTQPENRCYLSGYSATDLSITESSGILIIPVRGTPLLLTDSRYQLQAESEAPEFEVIIYPRGVLPLLKKLLPAMQIKRLAFESHYMLHATAIALAAMAKKIDVRLFPVSGTIEKLRARKHTDEIDKIRQSVKLNEKVFEKVYPGMKPGQTERQVALNIETTMRKMGAEGPSFDTIVAGGPNGALPHAVPSDRPLKEGEPIVIDMGTRYRGYCSDMTRTVVLGEPDEKTRRIIRLVRKAQLAGMKKIKSGILAKKVDRAARQVIAKKGYGKNFGHGLGHGVGLAIHEAPALNSRSRKKLFSGMVVTVEPGIYLPGWGGVRLENMVIVTDNGCDNLNQNTTFLDL